MKKIRKKCIEKVKRYYKKDYKNWHRINTEGYLKKKKIRKENTQEIDTRIYLKRTDKNKEKVRKIELIVCSKKNYKNENNN